MNRYFRLFNINFNHPLSLSFINIYYKMIKQRELIYKGEKFVKIGARTLKSGLAIFIAILIPSLLGIPDATGLSGLSATASMQPTVKQSFETFTGRLISNSVGAILAIFMTSVFGNGPMVIALTAILLISVLHAIDFDDAINLAVITLIVIMINADDHIIRTGVVRVLGTFIGVTVSFIVNQVVLPPTYDAELFRKLANQTDEIAKLIRSALRKNNHYPFVKDDINTLKKNQLLTDKLFTYACEEATFGISKSRRDKEKVYIAKRILVIYRQFIRTNKAGRDLVVTFHRYENTYNHFPEALRILIRERLETLTTAHEQIILKFSGRVRAREVNFLDYKRTLRQEFNSAFFKVANEDDRLGIDTFIESNSVVHLMSSIFAYEEEINHLNRLVSSYRIRHRDYRQEVDSDWNFD